MGYFACEKGGSVFVSNKKKPAAVMYIGPTIKAVAARNSYYNNGVPAELAKYIEEKPYMNHLIVTLEELPEAMKEINMKQGFYYEFYKKAMQEGE